MTKAKRRKASVQIDKDPGGNRSEVGFVVWSEDKQDLTAQQIIEAISQALILRWEEPPYDPDTSMDYDA